MAAFNDLAPELITNILERLDYRNLIVFRESCRKLRAIIDATVSLQYTILLGIHSMKDGSSSCKMTISERFSTLRAYQNLWNHADWQDQQDLPCREGGLWELAGDIFGQTPTLDSGTVELTQLLSLSRGVAKKIWTLQLEPAIIELTMDTSQDLLVLLRSTTETQ